MKCSYRDCDLEATYLADYVCAHIPLYGVRICEPHADELLTDHTDDTSTVYLLRLTPLWGTEE